MENTAATPAPNLIGAPRVPECFITGCALYNHSNNSSAWGDLWHLGDMWIFNAIVNAKGEAILDYNNPHIKEEKKCLITSGQLFFSRRGVFVIPKLDASLNELARLYKGI